MDDEKESPIVEEVLQAFLAWCDTSNLHIRNDNGEGDVVDNQQLMWDYLDEKR